MSADLTAIAVPALAAAITLLAWTFILLRTGAASRARQDAVRADVRGPQDRPWALAVGLAVAAALWLGLDQPILAAAAMMLWIGVVRIMRTHRRRRAESDELQYAVEAIGTAGRALRSGIPLPGVLRILAGESRGEAQRAFREIEARGSLGEDLATSIQSVLLTSPIPALRAFGLALIQQVAAGGNLAEVTDRLARSLVERSRIRRRMRTILAYGRSAAIALVLTPLLVVPMLCQLLDGYADLLFRSPTGHVLLTIAAAMLVTGVAVIQRLTGVDQVSARRAA
jgi:tight adherence protein B